MRKFVSILVITIFLVVVSSAGLVRADHFISISVSPKNQDGWTTSNSVTISWTTYPSLWEYWTDSDPRNLWGYTDVVEVTIGPVGPTYFYSRKPSKQVKAIVTVPYVPEGIHSGTVRLIRDDGVDIFANIGVKIDVTPPGPPADLTASPSSWTNVNSFTVSWTNPSDTSGIAGAYYKLDSGPTNPSDGTWTAGDSISSISGITVNSEGTHPIYVWLKDYAGLVNEANLASTTIHYDATAPLASHSISGTLGANGWYISAPVFELSASDALSGLQTLEYRIGGGPWIPYDNSFEIASDGTHQIEYRATDHAGNTASQSLTIKLDTVPPSAGASAPEYTNSPSIVLDISSSSDSASGLSRMKVWLEGENEPSGWESYAPSKSIALPAGDGPKTVYLKVKDTAGHESGVASVTTTLDQTKPAMQSVSINGGATYTNSQSVMIDLLASDALSGVSEVNFSIDGTNWIGWQTYSQEKSFTLPSGDGEKTIYVKVRDRVGNESDVASSGIILDTVPPVALGIEINGGASSTSSTSVTLTLSADDNTSGVAKMQFSTDGSNWTNWETYSASKSFTLPSGDGEKTIYFRVKDKAGNISDAIGATITLKTPTPAPPPSPSPSPSPQPPPAPTETSTETEEQEAVETEPVAEPTFELLLPIGPITNTDGKILVVIRIFNPGNEAITKHCELNFNGSSVPITITVQPGENKETTVSLDVPENLRGDFSVVLADDAGEELAVGTLTLAGTSEPEPAAVTSSPKGSPNVLLAALALGAVVTTLGLFKLTKGKPRKTKIPSRLRKRVTVRSIKPSTADVSKSKKYDELMERAKIHKEYRENSVD